MKCDDAKEYVMAVYDGETVPRGAAEHTAHCPDCQELLKGYAEMGATLRSYGSLLLAEPVPERIWPKRMRNTTKWWQKGFHMMRIPRLVFGCLVLSLIVLGSRLALVEVHAHDDGSVLMLKLTPAQGDSIQCDISTSDMNHNNCGGLVHIDRSNLLYSVKALKKDGSRVLLSIRSQVAPPGPASFGPKTASTLPETQSWFTPGDTLSLPGTGEPIVTLTGKWTDHIPVGGNQLSDPKANEIRMDAPLLLRNNKVVGDMGNLSAWGKAVSLYVPGEGRFILTLVPITGSIPAAVHLNRVSFENNGHKYVWVSGMPVSRTEKLWVLQETAYKPKTYQGPVITAGTVSTIE